LKRTYLHRKGCVREKRVLRGLTRVWVEKGNGESRLSAVSGGEMPGVGGSPMKLGLLAKKNGRGYTRWKKKKMA